MMDITKSREEFEAHIRKNFQYPKLSMLTLLGLTGSFESMQERYANMLAAAPENP